MTISVLPSREDVALGDLTAFEPAKGKLSYAGRDATVMQRFGTEQTNLLLISQANPRRKLQMRYLQEILKIDQVPETTIVERIFRHPVEHRRSHVPRSYQRCAARRLPDAGGRSGLRQRSVTASLSMSRSEIRSCRSPSPATCRPRSSPWKPIARRRTSSTDSSRILSGSTLTRTFVTTFHRPQGRVVTPSTSASKRTRSFSGYETE